MTKITTLPEHMPQTYKVAYNQSIKTLDRLAVT